MTVMKLWDGSNFRQSLQSLFEWHLLILYGAHFPPNVRPSAISVLSVLPPERELPTPGLVHRAEGCSTQWVFDLKMNESFWVLSTHFFFLERVQARKLTDISEGRCSSLPDTLHKSVFRKISYILWVCPNLERYQEFCNEIQEDK